MANINLVNEIRDPLFIEANDASILYECNNSDDVVNLTNLVQEPSKWTKESTNGSVENEVFVYPANSGTIMFRCNMPTPTSGHKYYLRIITKFPEGTTVADDRYEYWAKDPAQLELHPTRIVSNNNWVMCSDVKQVSDTSGTWAMRNFNVNNNNTVYRKEPMVIDLTSAFGSGNEPDKEWCDKNIPYFVGSKDVSIQKRLIIEKSSELNDIQHLSYLKIIPNVSYAETYARSKFVCNYTSGHKYYISIDVKSNRSNSKYNVYFPLTSPYPNINQGTDLDDDTFTMYEQNYPKLDANIWSRASFIFSTSSIQSGQYNFRFDNDNLQTDVEVCFTNLIVIDLTSAFGVGKEPNLTWLNTNIVLDADGTPKIKSSDNESVVQGVNGLNYINFVMKQPSKKIYTKIQYLDKNERVLGEIHGRCMGGSINIANSEMVRRTLSMDFLANDKLEIRNGSPFWIDKKLRIFTGVEDLYGNLYWYNQGTYIPLKPQTNVSLSGRTITLEASDKFCIADCHLESVMKISEGTSIATSIMELMNLVDKTGKTIINSDDYTMPYSYETALGDRIVDKVQEIQNLYMDYECYYDLNGYLVFDKTKNHFNDVPIWTFKDDYDFTISRSISCDYNEIYNQFYVYGYYDDKVAIQPFSKIVLPENHRFSEKNIGRIHRLTLQDDKWFTQDQCDKQAKYHFQKSTNMINSFSLVCAPIYTLNEVNRVIKVSDNGNDYTCLVDNITYPLGIGDSMTIGCHEIFEQDEEVIISHDR